MDEILGEFPESLPSNEECLLLGFSPSLLPLNQRWRSNGLSADFLADYLMCFLRAEKDGIEAIAQHPQQAIAKPAEIHSAISYIANELLENAMKFNDYNSSHPISIQLQLYRDKLIFLVTNSIKPHTLEKFKTFIQEILISDPREMLLRRLEKNAQEEHLESSGIGILCIMSDYPAKIGWKFTKIPENSEVINVTTIVQLML
ncbi:ATP-binding protein [Anabaena azotica FACHB-119]|uniref:ATP-binding protein n=2 Tax=Anabaena azotica TaxID=197653 RepID=A0ABR8D6R2_9NOST|nr:ATP-binding protein [Anabaena azotica FACHB-119]